MTPKDKPIPHHVVAGYFFLLLFELVLIMAGLFALGLGVINGTDLLFRWLLNG